MQHTHKLNRKGSETRPRCFCANLNQCKQAGEDRNHVFVLFSSDLRTVSTEVLSQSVERTAKNVKVDWRLLAPDLIRCSQIGC